MRKVLGPKSTQPDLLIIDTLNQERNFKEMIERARQAAERYPDERSFKLLEAQGLGHLDQVEEAIKLLDRMLSGSTEDIDVLSTKAVVLTDAERYKDAEAAIQEGLRRDPRSNGLLVQLSLIQERLGQFAESEAALRKLLEKDPDNAVALNNLGYYLAERGERLQESLELIRRAVNIDPTNGAYLDSLGWVYFQLGKLDEAKQYLEQAIIYQPSDATIHEHLGDLYLRQKRTDEAERAYRKGAELAKESREKKRIQEKLEKVIAGKSGK
jgi:tetratricopeptide (TPR) repeat protein